MSSSPGFLRFLVFACLASLGLTEQYIKSIITGYGRYPVDATLLSCIVLTRISGFASSSNTLSTGAQGSEHSASFDDPGDCATNVAVYPIGTLIYVVVGAIPHSAFFLARSSSHKGSSFSPVHLGSHSNRDCKNTSRSKTFARNAPQSPSRTSTSGWECPATATNHSSEYAPVESRSQTRQRLSSSAPLMDTTLIRRR